MILRTIFFISLVSSFAYMTGLFLIYKNDLTFTSTGDWLFRILIIVSISTILLIKKRLSNHFLSIREGLKIGVLSTLLLSFLFAAVNFVYCQKINPTFTDDLKSHYKEMHYQKMLRKYVHEQWKKDTVTQGAIDTVNRGIELNIEKYTSKNFTTIGQVQITIFHALLWGFLVSLTVSMLVRNVNE